MLSVNLPCPPEAADAGSLLLAKLEFALQACTELPKAKVSVDAAAGEPGSSSVFRGELEQCEAEWVLRGA